MKVDIYNAWEHLRIDEEDERRLLADGLVKRATDNEWRFNETCFICRHWVYRTLERNFAPLGECRHDPPAVGKAVNGSIQCRGVWPCTRGFQFCGAIETHISEQQLAERVALFRADCRKLAGENEEILAAS